MRNPERIPQVMSLLTLIWDKQPDVRFNQLIINLQYEYDRKNGEHWRETLYKREKLVNHEILVERSVVDLFSLEDDKFIAYLEEKVKELG